MERSRGGDCGEDTGGVAALNSNADALNEVRGGARFTSDRVYAFAEISGQDDSFLINLLITGYKRD